MSTNRYCLPISILFGCSVIWAALKLGGNKTIIGTNPDLVFLYKHCTVFSGKLAMVTGSGVTLYQGAPGSKFSKAPLVEVLKARVEHRICTSFLGGPGHIHPENF
jgi:hypothetical protein